MSMMFFRNSASVIIAEEGITAFFTVLMMMPNWLSSIALCPEEMFIGLNPSRFPSRRQDNFPFTFYNN